MDYYGLFRKSVSIAMTYLLSRLPVFYEIGNAIIGVNFVQNKVVSII